MASTTTDRLILINQAARSIVPVETLVGEIADATAVDSQQWMQDLAMCVSQSHPLPGEIEEAALSSGAKPRATACQILRTRPLGEALRKVVSLPANERVATVRFLTRVLGVADARRRSNCGDSCSHWWHADLASPVVIDALRRGSGAAT